LARNYSLTIPNNRYSGVGTLVPFDETKVPTPKYPTIGSYFTSIPYYSQNRIKDITQKDDIIAAS